MSHGDRVEAIPPELRPIAHSANSPYAAVRTRDGLMRGIQFHPEVAHTPCGAQVLRNFVLKICGEAGDWTMASFVETKVAEIRERVGSDDRVHDGIIGRRRFVGRGGADPSRDRRPSQLRVRR